MHHQRQRRGFSLLESLITIAVVVLMAQVVYSWALLLQRNSRDAQARSVANSVAIEYIELIRNASYDNVGTTTGFPVGTFLASQVVQRGDLQFTVQIAIDEIDDPYDGDATGSIANKPVDTVPGDYKRIEVSVCWNADCSKPVQLTSTVSPKSLESANNTGALFISVTDANGLAVPLVDVQVTNTTTGPPISIINKTDNQGKLQLLSLPPADSSYHVVVSKAGYSSDQTLPPSGGNPNPVNRDTSVIVASVTQISLSIDRVSTIVVQAEQVQTCGLIPSVQFTLTGSKFIGLGPDVIKFLQTYTTDATGQVTIPNLEFDKYDIQLLGGTYDLAGTDPPLPLQLAPNSSLTMHLWLVPQQSHSLLVTVLDAGTKLPLTTASAQVTRSGYDTTLVTNQGYLSQTDWSGGSGQATIGSADRYLSSVGGVSDAIAGQLQFGSSTQNLSAQESFDTNTLRDTPLTTAVWATGTLTLPDDSFSPGQFVGSAAAQSLKLNSQAGKITTVTVRPIATLNGQTIDYSIAADGITFEAVTPNVAHIMAVPGSDLRWRAILATTNVAVTPSLEQLDIEYSVDVLDGTNGSLTSSTFDTSVASTFSELRWTPLTQPASAGLDSFKVQIATNTNNSTWNYVGPDGTNATYYTASGATLSVDHANQRYLRYKAFFNTEDPLVSPTVSDISIIHSNSCFPPGQVHFTPLPSAGDYTLEISKTGYQETTQTVTVGGATRVTVLMTAN